tara:strand:+ start:1603 stop:3729 length:2127 start_codon:yes stop_codon:yes gene_type:complete
MYKYIIVSLLCILIIIYFFTSDKIKHLFIEKFQVNPCDNYPSPSSEDYISLNLSRKTTYICNEQYKNNEDITCVENDDNIFYYQISNGIYFNKTIKIYKSGTEQQYVYLYAETPGKVVFKDNTEIKVEANYVHITGIVFDGGSHSVGPTPLDQIKQIYKTKPLIYLIGNHISFSHNIINNVNSPTNYYTDDGINYYYQNVWIQMSGKHMDIFNNILSNKKRMGNMISVVRTIEGINLENNHRIHNNYFKNFIRDFDDGSIVNGYETIRLGTGLMAQEGESNIQVYDNLFEKCNGEIEIISVKCKNVNLSNNTFLSCEGYLTLRNAGECNVENNVFLINNTGNRAGGIRILGENHTISNNYISGVPNTSSISVGIWIQAGIGTSRRTAKNIRISNNTLYNNYKNIYIGDPNYRDEISNNIELTNNIIYTTIDNSSVLHFDSIPTNISFNDNLFNGPLITYRETIHNDNKINININDDIDLTENNGLYLHNNKGAQDLTRLNPGDSWVCFNYEPPQKRELTFTEVLQPITNDDGTTTNKRFKTFISKYIGTDEHCPEYFIKSGSTNLQTCKDLCKYNERCKGIAVENYDNDTDIGSCYIMFNVGSENGSNTSKNVKNYIINDNVWDNNTNYDCIEPQSVPTSEPEPSNKLRDFNYKYVYNSKLHSDNISYNDCVNYCQTNDECKGYTIIPSTITNIDDDESKDNKCILLH